jgi:hypothetical protein
LEDDPVRRLIGVISFLVILAGLAVGADRVAAGYAADRAERELAAQGFRGPEVAIRGFPFLTQFVEGEYQDVTVHAESLKLDDIRVDRVAATLGGMRLDNLNAPQEVRTRTLVARATVPYSQVERAADVPTLQIGRGSDGEGRLTGESEFLGRSLSVAARGRIAAKGDQLRVTATGFEVEGLGNLDDRLSDLLRDQFSLDYPIPGLPRGVHVRKVTPGATGFVVDVSGRNSVLRRP